MQPNKKHRWVQVRRDSRPPSSFGEGMSKNLNLEAAIPLSTPTVVAHVTPHAIPSQVVASSVQ